MASYVLGAGANHVFDPAVGAGAFFKAAKKVASAQDRNIELLGTEIDPAARQQALESGLCSDDLSSVAIGDFVLQPPTRRFDAVIANPPYIRHHRLGEGTKSFLKQFGARLIGRPLDGRAGYHVYFFIRGLQVLARGGRLAFIMPADVCEGVFSNILWRWVTSNYRLDAVITFAVEATPFPAVDTNAMVFMLRNENPRDTFTWARCLHPDSPALEQWVTSKFGISSSDIYSTTRSVNEALVTGLSRPPSEHGRLGPVLGDFARVMRGIATGSNDFFFLTRERAAELGVPRGWLVRAVGRTRDIKGDQITGDMVKALQAAGRPTYLLSLDSTPTGKLPLALKRYIKHGEELGVSSRALITTRKPWYKMEVRKPPPFLFAYLGRRHARFVRNLAGVVPLTGFLCIYPTHTDSEFIGKLWDVLRDSETIANLSLVGKSYGSGAIKVEPRALERLPLSSAALNRAGLNWTRRAEQLELAPV